MPLVIEGSESAVGSRPKTKTGSPYSQFRRRVQAASVKILGALLSPVWASLMVQMVKNSPAMQETWIQTLDREDSLEKEIPTPVFLPGEFHGQRSLVGYSPWCHKESDTTE